MKISRKIILLVLPLLLGIFLVSAGTSYYLSHLSLTDLAFQVLKAKTTEAVEVLERQQLLLETFALEGIPAGVHKAQLDSIQTIEALEQEGQGRVIVLDQNGVVLHHSEPDLVGSRLSGADWFAKLLPPNGTLTYNQGGSFLASYQYFQPWQWIVMVSEEEQVLFGPAGKIHSYLAIFCTGGAIVLAIALMVLTRQLVAPLQRLTAGAKEIGRGNMDIRIAVSGRDEFADLAEVFNQMTQELQQLLDGLEQRVLERTEELTEVNVRLKQEMQEKTMAMKALSASERRLSAILRASPIGIGLVIDRTLDWANEAMYQILHYDMNSLAGKPSRLLYANEKEYERVGSWLAQEAATSGTSQLETSLLRGDGKLVNCRIKAAPLDPHDLSSGVLVALTDLSEAKLLEAKLQRAQKMEAIGLLAGGVAHDLNNILSALVSYPELIMLDLPADSPLRKPLTTMKNSGERAAVIVQDLLTMARRGVPVREPINLNALVNELLDSPEMGLLASEHPAVQLEVQLEENLALIEGSKSHVVKSIVNLLFNGAEAMRDGGQLLLATSNIHLQEPMVGYEVVPAGRYAVVLVRDQGTGMTKTDLDRVFEPFYTRKQMGRSGSGLGMAVVWGTIKDHGGFVSIESSRERGTTVELFFPAAETMLQTEAEQAPLEKITGRGEKLLIVDDSAAQREIAVSIARRLGYQTETCDSGEMAIAYCADNDADLILLDMIMEPGIDGLDTYLQIEAIKPQQKIIIVSGYSESERVQELQQRTGCLYVQKPYSLESLGAAIRNSLEQ